MRNTSGKGMEMSVDRKKLGKTNRRKGINYERKVARNMTKYTGDKWNRAPYSGASYIEGDIVRLNKEFPYVIECKNRKDITLDKIFRRPELLTPYISDSQILIFNNRGQSLVVYPSGIIKVYSSKICAIIELENEVYYMESLKDFCKELVNEKI